jgi:hypothetical protein
VAPGRHGRRKELGKYPYAHYYKSDCIDTLIPYAYIQALLTSSGILGTVLGKNLLGYWAKAHGLAALLVAQPDYFGAEEVGAGIDRVIRRAF